MSVRGLGAHFFLALGDFRCVLVSFISTEGCAGHFQLWAVMNKDALL